jgi:hypothetical protein
LEERGDERKEGEEREGEERSFGECNSSLDEIREINRRSR